MAVILAATLMTVGEELSNPLPWTPQRWGGFLMKLTASLMGILMPGWRRGGVVSVSVKP